MVQAATQRATIATPPVVAPKMGFRYFVQFSWQVVMEPTQAAFNARQAAGLQPEPKDCELALSGYFTNTIEHNVLVSPDKPKQVGGIFKAATNALSRRFDYNHQMRSLSAEQRARSSLVVTNFSYYHVPVVLPFEVKEN